MKKVITFFIIFNVLVLLITVSCDSQNIDQLNTAIDEIQDNNQEDAKTNSDKKSSIDENNVTDSESSIKEEKSLLYNPPSEGNPENIGKIIFCSRSGETQSADYYLYTINSDGSNMEKLTDFGEFMKFPAWSPEYSRIAYSSSVDNNDKIFIMTADGAENKQLTFGDSDDKFPTWSPDGNYIAYISYIDNTPNLFVIDIHGNNMQQLTFVTDKDTVLWPSWSPVSDLIAYTYNEDGSEIGERLYTIKSDGTEMTELIVPDDARLHDGEPAWSHDGNILYFISNRSRQSEIWKLDYYKLSHNLTVTDGTKYDDIGLMQVSNLYSSGVSIDHNPAVSPDDNKIVFYGSGQDWIDIGTNLYVINIDETGLTNITQSINGDEWPDW